MTNNVKAQKEESELAKQRKCKEVIPVVATIMVMRRRETPMFQVLRMKHGPNHIGQPHREGCFWREQCVLLEDEEMITRATAGRRMRARTMRHTQMQTQTEQMVDEHQLTMAQRDNGEQ